MTAVNLQSADELEGINKFMAEETTVNPIGASDDASGESTIPVNSLSNEAGADGSYEYDSPGGNPFAGGSNPLAGGEASGFGGGAFGDPLAPDEGYEYDFASSGSMRTPFDDLLEFEEFDNVGDIFGGGGADAGGGNPFGGGGGADAGGGNPFGGSGGADAGGGNPFGGGGMPSGGSSGNPSQDDSSDPFVGFDPNTDGSPFTEEDDVPSEGASGVEETPVGGSGSMMGGGFSGSIDTGVGNTDNGNGNNFLGDAEGNSGSNNQADGNGNWFYGSNNQASGNGNWNFGEGNQVNGNGNWNLNEEGGTPFDNVFAGENNPLGGGNPLGFGEGDSSLGDVGGNNPVLAGGSTTPTPVGDGETPDTAKNPTGDQNVVNGNGNWNFGSTNDISGNGNWSFGDNNVIDNGNGNWNLGDDNQVSGNGNRPSGSDNSISGNSNRVSGDGNSINGNRFDLDEDNLNIYGNADRYFKTDADGNVTLVSDESASDPNYEFDFTEVAGASNGGESDELLNGGEMEMPVEVDTEGQDVVDQVYGSLNGAGTGLPSTDAVAMGGAAGIFPEGEPTDVPPDVLPVA